jgi:serine/threonine protein kinase
VEQIIHQYQVTAKLGEGGMGEVFLAHDTKLNRLVALKLLPKAIATDLARRRRFLSEAQAASALTHPNVCTIYEVGETPDGCPYIAMEYLKGRSLAELSRQQPFSLPQIVSVGVQVTDALDSAYELRIVHRDIKPSNITLNDRGQVKVLDFGLAKRLTEDQASDDEAETLAGTKSGQVVGTPAYMSPEQALGKAVDHRSDIFSLGVVLYELATGRRPFAGASLGDTIDKIVHHRPEPLAQIVSNLPSEFERIVMKCLEKEPSRRYQSPRDLVLDLQNLQRRLDLGPALPAKAGEQVAAPATSTRHEGTGSAPEEIPPSDIFISYAAADDKQLTAEQSGWVTQFHRDLEVRVEQLFGEPASIWRHANPPGTPPPEARLAEVLPGAKALICVLSPPFVKSPGCRRDLDLFFSSTERSKTLLVDNRCRVLKVLKRPIEPGEWSPPLSDLLPRLPGFEFYEQDGTSGRLLEYDDSFGPMAKQRYHERIYDLAQEVCHVLKAVRRLNDSKATNAAALERAGKTIFLAETTADLRPERDKLRRELTERGHQVIPANTLPLEAAELRAELQGSLVKADATVHLIGGRYGLIPEGADTSLVEIQLQSAQAHAKTVPHLIWMRTGLTIEDPRQAALVNRLQTDPALHAQGELIQGSLNLLKDLLLRRIDPPPKTNPTPPPVAASGPPRVYLICDAADEEAVGALEDFLFENGCEVSLPLFVGTSGEIAEAHRRNLQTCDAVLIYYGSTVSHWVEIKLLDLAQAPGYGRARPFKAQAVLVPPSEDRRKNRFRTHLAEVIRQEVPGSTEALLPFLRTLQPAAG